MEKIKASRCSELFVICPYCSMEEVIIPDIEIKNISNMNPEKHQCQNCKKYFLIKGVI